MKFSIILASLVLICSVTGQYDDIVSFDAGNSYEVSHANPWSSMTSGKLPKNVHHVEPTADKSPDELGNENEDVDLLTFPTSSKVPETTTTLPKKEESSTSSNVVGILVVPCKPNHDEILAKISLLLHWIYAILCFLVVMCSVIGLVYVTVLISNFFKSTTKKSNCKNTKVYIISAPFDELSKC